MYDTASKPPMLDDSKVVMFCFQIIEIVVMMLMNFVINGHLDGMGFFMQGLHSF